MTRLAGSFLCQFSSFLPQIPIWLLSLSVFSQPFLQSSAKVKIASYSSRKVEEECEKEKGENSAITKSCQKKQEKTATTS